MNIKIENENQKTETLSVGDIVEVEGDLYFVVYEGGDKDYILRGFINGEWLGYNGSYNSLESLTNSIQDESFTVYSKGEYELVLRGKDL